ncbi:hypothetical protein DM39_6143 [Burkholderia cenocepacia]|uniref:Uncharacterized protein n=1 Tax=Burkholderia cenocepacia TaxID=95486 RepID=A0AAN0RV60_9BURK|nr:hypothetical protein DM39_6143 [Burkholderia cenocepacia]
MCVKTSRRRPLDECGPSVKHMPCCDRAEQVTALTIVQRRPDPFEYATIGPPDVLRANLRARRNHHAGQMHSDDFWWQPRNQPAAHRETAYHFVMWITLFVARRPDRCADKLDIVMIETDQPWALMLEKRRTGHWNRHDLALRKHRQMLIKRLPQIRIDKQISAQGVLFAQRRLYLQRHRFDRYTHVCSRCHNVAAPRPTASPSLVGQAFT